MAHSVFVHIKQSEKRKCAITIYVAGFGYWTVEVQNGMALILKSLHLITLITLM